MIQLCNISCNDVIICLIVSHLNKETITSAISCVSENLRTDDKNINGQMRLDCIQLSRKVVGKSARDKGIVGGFEFTVIYTSLKEWHERQWTYVCKC